MLGFLGTATANIVILILIVGAIGALLYFRKKRLNSGAGARANQRGLIR